MENNYLIKNLEYLTKNLGRYNISQKLCKRFQSAIIDGKLPPGYMMPNEIMASTMLNVGRSTLREAYICLELSGFITRSKAGTFVNGYDEIQEHSPFLFKVNNIDDFVDVMEFRYMIEGETASYVAKRASIEDMDELITIHNEMVMAQDNLKKFVEYDQTFHTKIAEFSKNKMLLNTLTASKHIIIEEIFENLPKELEDKPETVQSIINSHKKILDCIVTRDYKGASASMREHITKVNFLMKFVPKPVYIKEDIDDNIVKSSANTQGFIRSKAKENRSIAERSVNRRTNSKIVEKPKPAKTKKEPIKANDLLPDNLMLGNLKNTNNLVESLVKQQLAEQNEAKNKVVHHDNSGGEKILARALSTSDLTPEQILEKEFNNKKKVVKKTNNAIENDKRNLSAKDLADRINFKKFR